MNTYLQLSTVIDMQGLLDLMEMHETHMSAKHAEMLNIDWKKNLPTQVR